MIVNFFSTVQPVVEKIIVTTWPNINHFWETYFGFLHFYS